MTVLTPLDRQKQCAGDRPCGNALTPTATQLGRSKSNMAAARDAGWMASSCNMTSYREMSVKGHRDISFACRQHRPRLIDFLLLAWSQGKLLEAGKE